MIPEIGTPYKFIPSVFEGQEYIWFAGRKYSTVVHGKIIAVNKDHKHFTVRGVHPESGSVLTETFKF